MTPKTMITEAMSATDVDSGLAGGFHFAATCVFSTRNELS